MSFIKRNNPIIQTILLIKPSKNTFKMINFISYNRADENKIIYQCEHLFDMVTREVKGEIILHRPSGKDITNLLKEWVELVMPIKWEIEVLESALNTTPTNKQIC